MWRMEGIGEGMSCEAFLNGKLAMALGIEVGMFCVIGNGIQRPPSTAGLLPSEVKSDPKDIHLTD